MKILKEEGKIMNFVKTYQEMVETYYSPFSFEIGENAPKLTKQLTKQAKEFTVEEVQAFQELLTAVYNNEKETAFTFDFSEDLPDYDEQDSWAFDGSCNSKGNAGEFTSEILNTLEEARYCYIYDEFDDPCARFYYLESNGVYALADLYSEQGHGFYLAPQIALCVAFGLKLADFTHFDCTLIYWDNENGFWSNLASSSYKHFTSGNFEPLYLDKSKVDYVYESNECYYSPNLGRYVREEDRDDLYYCENIDDYEEADNVAYCEHCDMYFSLSDNFTETENGNTFCCDDCALNSGYIFTDNGELVSEDEVFCCDDCYNVYLVEDAEEGADGCLYCCDCIHDHLEDEDED